MTTVLLDANNLAMRSYHAAKGRMTTIDGIETGSLHLFMRSLAMHLAQLSPTHFVAVWDGGVSKFREQIYPDYKLARRNGHSGPAPHATTFAIIQEFLQIIGLAQWRWVGYEADDLIAQAVQQAAGPITILSSDKDLLQLLSRDEVTQIRFAAGSVETDTWTRDHVIERMGCTPEQIPHLMALTGDASDGIPGARGIGPKKGLKLLQAHDWDLQKVAATLPDGDNVLMSYRLVVLPAVGLSELPSVPEYEPISLASPEEQWVRLRDFCIRYEFRVLWDDLMNGTLLARGSPS